MFFIFLWKNDQQYKKQEKKENKKKQKQKNEKQELKMVLTRAGPIGGEVMYTVGITYYYFALPNFCD